MKAEAVKAATILPPNSVLSNDSFSRYYYLVLTTSNSLNALEKNNKIGILKPGQTFVACDRVER